MSGQERCPRNEESCFVMVAIKSAVESGDEKRASEIKKRVCQPCLERAKSYEALYRQPLSSGKSLGT